MPIDGLHRYLALNSKGVKIDSVLTENIHDELAKNIGEKIAPYLEDSLIKELHMLSCVPLYNRLYAPLSRSLKDGLNNHE